MSLFQKLITETQISNPPEPAMDHDSLKLMILLPFIAIYFRSLRYEALCRILQLTLNFPIYPSINKCPYFLFSAL